MRLSRVRLMARAAVSLGLFCAFLFLSGCGSSTGVVSGKVTYKGNPLKGGTVGFHDGTGRTTGAAIKEDGTYKVSLPAGEYTVTVETRSMKPPEDGSSGPGSSSPPVVPKGKGGPPKDAKIPEGYTPSNPAESQAAKMAKNYVEIPGDYGNAQKSSLKYTVVGGEQTKDLELK